MSASADQRAAGSSATPPPISATRRNVSMVAVLLAMLMANIDASILNVALPQLSRDVHADPADTVWVTTAFLLAVSCAIPAMSGLADQFGRKRMFVTGVPVFTLASVACALAPTLPVLVAARVAQAVGAAMIFAVAIPIYRRLFPPERLGTVLGLNAMIVALGTCAGPTVGGLILVDLDWRWLFLVNVPIGVVSTVLAAGFIPHLAPPRGDYDLAGAVLAGATVASFLLGIHQLVDPGTAVVGAVLLAATIGLGALFVRVERRAVRPIIPLDMFTGSFNLAVLTAFWSFFGQGVAFVALPFLFQTAYHADPLQSALLFTPWPLVIVFVAPLSGRLADRYSTAWLTVIGLVVFTAGLLVLALLGQHPPIYEVLLATALTGVGFAIFQSPNNRDMMSAAPMRYASSAASILNVNRTLAQSAGSGAVSMALVLTGASLGSIATQAHAAAQVLYVAAGGGALSVVASIVKLRRAGTRSRAVAASEG
ncbi:MFS transporter [Galbitalea sp. SE-J8]|uniref:MFS transporter n=1 Tax=Galbitalea sp. SE-J8 TaxID=3054952 RepID=UPI00259CB604|nr:MFS transporter [Galbitalea sp. SE-J8]MDM4763427.1 MFS transporter [Galbitalea sp. SE-J8]